MTKWAVETLQKEKNPTLEAFLDLAMERKYSASPWETFFTGGGIHHFENFEPEDNKRNLELRDAFRNSTNLVFIRLMRDIVSYHRARLQYNSDAVLSDPTNPDRKRMLQEIAEEESRKVIASSLSGLPRADRTTDHCSVAGVQKRTQSGDWLSSFSPGESALMSKHWQLGWNSTR